MDKISRIEPRLPDFRHLQPYLTLVVLLYQRLRLYLNRLLILLSELRLRHVIMAICVWLIKKPDIAPCLTAATIVEAEKTNRPAITLKDDRILMFMLIIKRAVVENILSTTCNSCHGIADVVFVQKLHQVELL